MSKQLSLEFSEPLPVVFSRFVDDLRARGYTSRKVNSTACATILENEGHRVSIVPRKDRLALCVTEYEKGEPIYVPPPDNGFRKVGQWLPCWVFIKTYQISTTTTL